MPAEVTSRIASSMRFTSSPKVSGLFGNHGARSISVPVWHIHDSLADWRPASSLHRILETFQPQAHLTVCTRSEDDC
jgi:hypothetical protein